MSTASVQPSRKVLLIDSNVFFAKRLSDAIKREGLEVTHATQSAYALTMLEWEPPDAIVCATNLREMNAYEIPRILRSDPRTGQIPVIALGDNGEQALMEAFRAGCADYVDRRSGPEAVAAHIRQFLRSQHDGFQPTQMLDAEQTALEGNLSHMDLPGVIQMLGQTRQTGALHVNAGPADGIIFFDAGDVTHAECGDLIGDVAVVHVIKVCDGLTRGTYKFVPGYTASTRTVLRSVTELMLDALRELDEERNGTTGGGMR